MQKSWTRRLLKAPMPVAAGATLLLALLSSVRSRGEPSRPVAEKSQAPVVQEASSTTAIRQPARHQLLPHVPERERIVVTDKRIYNDEAAIPPQCYTKTESQHNPCYTCHQSYDRKQRDRLNLLDDGELQGGYNFSEIGVVNHWTNLFAERKSWMEQISDEAISAYVGMDNYSALAVRLKEADFKGFVPDLKDYHLGALAFDEHGLARDESGWVAFNYKPFPGTFWPTNGSSDDVAVRLPQAFRTLSGQFHRDTYYVNLTLVELNLKGLSQMRLWTVNEKELAVDLNGDGQLTFTDEITLIDHFVGDAREHKIDFEQYPAGTEFLHSVRYLGIDDSDRIFTPQRMKELRYMKKVSVLSRSLLHSRYDGERKEKRLGQLPSYLSRGDEGLDNKMGWFVKGFIEDYEGELRQQSLEEDMYCMGCHKAISTTIDSTFAFPRKVDGGVGWGYINLVGMKDVPNINEEDGEILNYLRRVGGGNEFRQNLEMIERWFDGQGDVKAEAVRAADVATLTTPSRRRAFALNKAYTHIVRHQSYRLGRDATVEPAQNVFSTIDEAVTPLAVDYRNFGWDLRLDWSRR